MHLPPLRPPLTALALAGSLAIRATSQPADPVYAQGFDGPIAPAEFVCTDADAWVLDRGSLWQHAPSDYEPAHRSPRNLAMLRPLRFGSFVLEADVMQTGREYGHRDVCLVFAFQDPEHFCYAHLSSQADENAHHVFLVDGAPRTAISSDRTRGVDWGRDAWRRLRVEVDPEAGSVRVLLDGEQVLTSDAVPPGSGHIGFGTFDDEVRIDNIRVWSEDVVPVPCEAFEPMAGTTRDRPVRLEPLEGSVRVTLGEEPFAEYVYEDVIHPFIAPVNGPGGVRMTRAFPIQNIPGEAHDHPHHTGLWWAHGDINGVDVWHRGRMTLIDGPHTVGSTITSTFSVDSDEGPTGVTVVESLTFGETLSGDRTIDVRVGVSPPPGGELVFGDTKEGTMAIRTHPSLRLAPDPGAGVAEVTGLARNSEGVEGKAVWGRRAAWIDYSGRIDGAPVGVAIFDHPANPRFPTWWHAREYGLVAANPFGLSDFEGGEPRRGRMVVPASRNVSFQYRFLFHRFGPEEARVQDAYRAWAHPEPRSGAPLDWIARESLVLNDDGGWCWFGGERAIIVGGTLVAASVASGSDDAARAGDIELTTMDLQSGGIRRFELHDRLERDDHDQPGLCDLGGGRVLALWSKHGHESRIYGAIVDLRTGNVTPSAPIVPSESSRVTYSNVFRLPGEGGRIYSFFRGLDDSWKPSLIVSDDGAATWRAGNTVIDVPSQERHRPYVRYVSDGESRVHLLYTPGHPRDLDNSVYHVVYADGALRASDGEAIAPLTQGLASPESGTRVFEGSADRVPWVVDLRMDRRAHPVGLFSVQVGSAGMPPGQGGDDHRYCYARWDGAAWRVHEMAFAGTRLYPGEDDYTGLAAIDPLDPETVVISTNADPATGAPLVSRATGEAQWELFKGATADSGETWTWEPLTRDSSTDNLRPVVAADGEGRRVLLWLRGRYSAYTDFDQQVMAIVNPW